MCTNSSRRGQRAVVLVGFSLIGFITEQTLPPQGHPLGSVLKGCEISSRQVKRLPHHSGGILE